MEQSTERDTVPFSCGPSFPQFKSARILLVHRGPHADHRIQPDLEAAGYAIEIVERDGDAADWLRRGKPDLIILDGQSSDQSGVDICEQVRTYAGKVATPIVTIVGHERDGLRTLFVGADDFVLAPVSTIHLVARVQSLLRRARPDRTPVLRAGDIELDLDCHRATRAGRALDLGPTEFRLLKLMMESPGRAFSRKELLKSIWGLKAKAQNRTVDNYVSRLRKAVNRGARVDAFRTIRGLGYALEADRAAPK